MNVIYFSLYQNSVVILVVTHMFLASFISNKSEPLVLNNLVNKENDRTFPKSFHQLETQLF